MLAGLRKRLLSPGRAVWLAGVLVPVTVSLLAWFTGAETPRPGEAVLLEVVPALQSPLDRSGELITALMRELELTLRRSGVQVVSAPQADGAVLARLGFTARQAAGRWEGEVTYFDAFVSASRLLAETVQDEFWAAGVACLPPRASRVKWLGDRPEPATVLDFNWPKATSEAAPLTPPSRSARLEGQRAVADALFRALERFRRGEGRDPSRSANPKVAIVIDDFGGDREGVAELLTIRCPLTVAVIPGLRFSTADAEAAQLAGFEVILHLPMEMQSGRPSWYGPDPIMIQSTEEEVRRIVAQALATVPQAVGLNNHLGSRASADLRVMRYLARAAREARLYMFDSRTTAETVLELAAREEGVPAARRQVFLDNVKSPLAIRQAFRQLRERALRDGQAVAVGHVGAGGRVLATILKEMTRELARSGIELVYLSELVSTGTNTLPRSWNN